MNYTLIKPRDIADGPGIRVALFVSGCTHHCKGCFNPETWPFGAGQPYTPEVQQQLLELLKKPYIRGLTLLGGEPFEPQNQPVVLELVREVRRQLPGKTIWSYSGYTLDTDILQGRAFVPGVTGELLSLLDVLVDGEFHLAEKNPDCRFRGSVNQRLIDVPETLKTGAVVLWDGKDEP